MAVSWLLAAGERHSSARRSIRTARPGPIEPPRRAGHADMRTTHIGVKATELQHQQTSLTLNQKHNVEPWGGIANPRTPLLVHAADKCISAPYPVPFLSVPILSNPSTRPQAADHSRCCRVPIQQCRTVESDKHRPVQWRHALGPENVAASAYLYLGGAQPPRRLASHFELDLLAFTLRAGPMNTSSWTAFQKPTFSPKNVPLRAGPTLEKVKTLSAPFCKKLPAPEPNLA